ncbi:MAG: hypothetical protein IKC70_05745 [Bacteroidaceae bacterium]|nr:hypothetical protein [Bacteroidaceae bacterium]
MKKVIFTILLSVLALTTFAQRDNLLEDGRRWVTFGWGFSDYSDSDDYIKWYISEEGGYIVNNITIMGDTVINDTIYKKLYVAEGLYDCNDWNVVGKLEAFIRYENGKYLYRFLNDEVRDMYKKGYPHDFIGNEHLLFDENRAEGDIIPPGLEVVSAVNDTVYPRYSDYSLKYWKVRDANNGPNYYDYFMYFDDIKWIQGVGTPTTLIPYVGREYDCMCNDLLLFCIAADGDTIYRNKRYWYPEIANLTTVRKIFPDEISFTQRGGECVVTLPLDAAWSATLSNSAGVTVARCSGEGSEIILPATSKGTHILVVNAGGRVVKKKVFIK